MRYLLRFVFVLCMVVFCAGVSYADSLIGQFTIDQNNNPVASEGQVIFTLNADGTIAATLMDFGRPSIQGFGFNSPTAISQSGWAPPANPYYPSFFWLDIFGKQYTGFRGLFGQLGSQESWTIGTPGEFTTVWQALGGPGSTVDFFLEDDSITGGYQEWGAMAQPYSTTVTPEPGSFALLGMGMLAFGTIILLRKPTA